MKPPAPPLCRPRVEQLESRELLDASAFVDRDGVLRVTGTERADTILVTFGLGSSPSWFVSITDRLTGDELLTATFSAAEVRAHRVVTEALEGDDGVVHIEGLSLGGLKPGQTVFEAHGGPGDDTMVGGGSSTDLLFGGGDNDSLNGGGGSDALFGGPGVDSLVGSAGGDRVYAQPGDKLIGGPERQGDAVILLYDSPHGGVLPPTGDPYDPPDRITYSRSFWTLEEVRAIDRVFASFQQRTGDNALLRTRYGRLAVQRVGEFSDHNTGHTRRGVVYLPDSTVEHRPFILPDVLTHEVGHNWDEPVESTAAAPFRKLSGWSKVKTATSTQPSPDGRWWYRPQKAPQFFRADNGLNSPKEDFADSFMAALRWRRPVGKDAVILQKKWDLLNAWLNRL